MILPADVFKARLLIVDDQEANILLLDRILHKAGYTSVESTSDPLQVYGLHQKNRYDLILLDLLMPGMDGFQVMQGLKELEQDSYLPVLVITAESDQGKHAFQLGARDFISKPFELYEIWARVYNMIELRLLNKEAVKSSLALQFLNRNLQQLVKEQVQENTDAQLATILALSRLAEARDPDTGKHLERVREFCRLLAQEFSGRTFAGIQIDDAFIDNIFHASPLHDIGKVAIKDEILLKPGKLTPQEFIIMQKHTQYGADTLQSVHDQFPGNTFIAMGIQVARSHHEKWDGSGYPDGLAGEDIPFCAQIMALADVYDALRSKRCYKDAFTHATAREIILVERGRHFSPALMDAFNTLGECFEKVFNDMAEYTDGWESEQAAIQRGE